jgi:hypothetical protein
VNPGALITDIDHLEKIRIESCLFTALAEKGLVSSRAAGGNNNTVELLIFDGIFDFVYAGLGTGVEVFFHEYDVGQGFRILGQARAVQITSDVAAAVTDKDSNTDIFRQFHTSRSSPRRARRAQRKPVFLFISFLVMVGFQNYLF